MYTGQALELSASLMGMVQTSLNLLSLYRILIPFQMPAPSGTLAGAVAGPSVLPLTAGRERRGTPAHSRGRASRTHTESSSREPIPEDDETDEDEEPVSPQSESSQGSNDAGDGFGSNSGSGADDDSFEAMPRKRAKRASCY